MFLLHLCPAFHNIIYRISTERHRAEIRRAVNDELLGSVAGW